MLSRSGGAAGRRHRAGDPVIGCAQTVGQRGRRRPSEAFPYERVVAVASPHPFRGIEVIAAFQPDAGNSFDEVDQLINRHELVAADIPRFAHVPAPQAHRTIDSVKDEQ